MEKDVKKNYHTLNNAEKCDKSENEYLTVANGSVSISKEKSKNNNNNKKPKCLIDNSMKIRKKLLIPNSKCHFKKTDNSNIKQSNINMNKENSVNKKINIPNLKRNHSGFAQRNKNRRLPESKPNNNTSKINRIIFNNNNNNREQQKNKSLKSSRNNSLQGNKNNNNNNKNKLISQKTKKNNSLIKKNNQLKKNNSNSVNHYNNIGIKIIQNNGKNNDDCPKFITKVICRTNEINEKLNTTNYNRNINRNLNKNNNFSEKNEIIFWNPKNIYFNKNENNIFKKNIHSRSTSLDSPKIPYLISPIRIRNYNYENTNNIAKIIKIPLTKTDTSISQKDFPDNYSYHEITHFSSAKKKSNNNNNNNNNGIIKKEKEKERYINKNNKQTNDFYLIEKKDHFNRYNENNYNNNNYNYMNISNKQLINNLSFSHFYNEPPVCDSQSPYYSTFFNDKKRPLNINNDNVDYNSNNNICYCKIEGLVSPTSPTQVTNQKKNEEYIQSINSINGNDNGNENINETPKKIHYFGEQMLQRNKNYNYSKGYNNIKNLTNFDDNDNLNNNFNQKRIEENNFFTETLIIEKPSKIEENEKIKIKNAPNIINLGNNIINIKKNNNIIRSPRYSHNIISRKRKKKLVMEKKHNEEFIMQSNKGNNNNNNRNADIKDIKDKISYYDSSIIDTDSLNEIILEFEKEIEAEERKKNDENKNGKKIVNISNNDNSIKFSFFSDNDFSIMSKDSTNISKIQKRKKHYFKTKNIDMEKNYDFVIYGTKKNKSLKK